ETIAKDSEQMSQLRAIAAKFPGDNFRFKMIVTPWLSSDENGASFPDGQHIAFTHWSVDLKDKVTPAEGQEAPDSVGVYQYCTAVSGAAFKQFMTDHPYTDAREPNSM